jgi:AcrR family transcriptional regulator
MTGKRAEARVRTEADIVAAARRQLAEGGAVALSLREVAREVGMVSSAIYRYVDSRDALLTRLIIDAYDTLGSVTEQCSAAHAGDPDLDRWAATCGAIRSWSLDHPHDHLLLYGSPVPGYAAPDDTVVPGTRVTLALAGIVVEAASDGRLGPPSIDLDAMSPRLRTDLGALMRTADLDLPAEHIGAFLIAWTQLFGLISFEITNQTRGMFEQHGDFFDFAVRSTGAAIGLR